MADPRYLSSREACERLGVQAQTLYAYVSRGLVRSEAAGARSRARRYHSEDIARLRERKSMRADPSLAARAALGAGEPVMESSLTLITDYYQNVGSTDVTGLTLGADLQLSSAAFGYANYSYTRGDDGDAVANISQHKINAGVNLRAHRHLNVNLRANWRGRIQAPASNVYFHEKTAAMIAAVGYDYETAADPDGFLEGHFLLHATLTGRELGGGWSQLQPQLIVRNLLDEDYLQMGRQSGSGARPLGDLQPEIQNPQGFIPPYHPQPGREILLVLRYHLGE